MSRGVFDTHNFFLLCDIHIAKQIFWRPLTFQFVSAHYGIEYSQLSAFSGLVLNLTIPSMLFREDRNWKNAQLQQR